ncbi:unnamed protein product [Schistosoma mattheei]|uniref:Uncharacterized protein n=1 Tax=Schistosoma mattheei TaxID=31246 RepID=A0A183NGH5_9TREM|nr:unnamed protein product [Schistosoma mattheei]
MDRFKITKKYLTATPTFFDRLCTINWYSRRQHILYWCCIFLNLFSHF